MIELQVQKFLRDSGTLDDLENKIFPQSDGPDKPLAIKSKRHGQYKNLVLLKYNQIDSPMSHPIVQECRGIILDQDNNWNVVARAFNKFFNHGEGHAAVIDWSTARIQEKVDGSLCLLYFYDNCWHVATTGTPDACGGVNNSDLSFADYFWNTLAQTNGFQSGNFIDDSVMRNYCFMFELTGPLNRVVVVHDKPSLTLLGARRTDTWEEVHPSTVAHFFNIPVVKEYPLQTLAQIVATFEHMSPLSQEGYVVVDAKFNRIKIKSPSYVALHHAKDGMTTKAFVEIVRSGETSEVLAAFPEFLNLMTEVQYKYNKLLTDIETDYQTHKDIVVQKDFALAVKDSKCSAALFQMRAGKIKNMKEFLAKINIDMMMRLLGY